MKIIGIFGSVGDPDLGFDNLRLAEDLGFKLSEFYTVLTGFGDQANGATVKYRAILGASNNDKPYLGIAQGIFNPNLQIPQGGTIIGTQMQHKRNFVEALICDAAIAIKGGDGTLSEAYCCLALNKPLITVGQVVEGGANGPMEGSVPFHPEMAWYQANALVRQTLEVQNGAGPVWLDALIDHRLDSFLANAANSKHFHFTPTDPLSPNFVETIVDEVIRLCPP